MSVGSKRAGHGVMAAWELGRETMHVGTRWAKLRARKWPGLGADVRAESYGAGRATCRARGHVKGWGWRSAHVKGAWTGMAWCLRTAMLRTGVYFLVCCVIRRGHTVTCVSRCIGEAVQCMAREKVLGRELALDGQTGTRAGCVIAWTPRPCTDHAGRPVAMGLLETGLDLDVGLHKRRLKMGLTLDPIK